MSLVLEALRRVERASGEPGRVGAAIASYRPASNRRGVPVWPLLLGLGAGAILVVRPSEWRRPAGPAAIQVQPPTPLRARGGAGLPPPIVPASVPSAIAPPSAATTGTVSPGAPRHAASRAVTRPSSSPTLPPFVLQAISESAGRPIAIVSDRLVREGDILDTVRVLHIGNDAVELLHPDGRSEVIHFPPPPPAEVSPSPDPR